MKKFISNISTSTANAVNSAVKQIDKTLDKTLTAEHHAQPAAHSSTPGEGSKQYLRLPVDSAKKLRWFDKGDVAALTRQHVREKHLLLDTITALKKVMIRAGFTDSSLDEEARQLVEQAEAVRVADHGTESVLLLAVQAEVEALTVQRQAMQQELQQLQDRLHDAESRQGAQLTGDLLPQHGSSDCRVPHGQQQLKANGNVDDGSKSEQANPLLAELQASYAALQAAVTAAARTQAQVCSQELLLAATNTAVTHQQQPSTAELARQSSNRQEATPAPAPSQQQSQHQPQQQPQQQSQQQSSDPVAAAPSPDVVKRYREFTLQLEERCRAAERSASLSAARVASLEESLAAAQASLAAAQQRAAQAAAQARQQISHLEERLRTAEAAAAAASATPTSTSGGNAAAAAAAAAAEGQLGQLQQQLAASRMQVTNLERRLADVEGREASLISELRSAEAGIAERDAALAAAAAVREQLGELSRERSRLEHYKQRVLGLEGAKADLEGQMSGMAALVATLETRLREVTAQSTAATAAAELAAAAAAKAQAAVAEQVAVRLAAAGHNRSMWPPAARHAVEELEQQVEVLNAALAAVRSELEATARQLQEEQQEQLQLQQKLQDLESQLIQAEHDASVRAVDLQSTLDCCQVDADNLREQVLQLEQQLYLSRQSSLSFHNSGGLHSTAGGVSYVRRSGSIQSQGSAGVQAFLSSAGSAGIVNSSSAAGAAASGLTRVRSSQKWQEQNKVGGGSLYGVADSAVEAVAQQAVGTAQRETVSGVDLVYLKNVILKFLEAVMAGKAAERDALLPAVSAVLQATPAEFAAMRKVLAATAPPGMQVMSVLGRLGQLAS